MRINLLLPRSFPTRKHVHFVSTPMGGKRVTDIPGIGPHWGEVLRYTNSTSCSLTYEQVYKSLTKNENSFNISHALYPEGRKPSFLVKVNVYGPNKSHNSIPAKFTQSIHCLFSSVPASLLEMLSLGSIIVTSRTQELNIQIPAFCCNLSENIENRKEMIQGFLTRAVFEVSADFV